MYRQTAGITALCGMLLGCSASIPVTQVEKGVVPKGEGTLLILPRTTLSLKYNVVTSTFTAGRWTEEVDACHASIAAAKSKSSVRAALDSLKDSCKELLELGLSTKRPSKIDKTLACPDTDSKDTESRTSINAGSLSVAAGSQPDPDHVYWVETPSRWLGSADVTVKYLANGTVDGAKTVVTNPWADFTVELAGMAVRGALFGAGGAKKALQDRCVVLSEDKNPTDPKIKSDCELFFSELADLRTQVQSKQAVMGSMILAPGFEVQMRLLDERIAQMRAQFEGEVETKSAAKVVNWIPPASDTGAGLLDAKCGLSTPVECIVDTEKATASLNCSAGIARVAVCPAPATGDASEWPAQELRLGALRDKDAEVLLKSVEDTLCVSRSGSFGDDGKSRCVADPTKEATSNAKRGFPYRFALQSDVVAKVLKCKNSGADGDAAGAMATTSLPIAQYGKVGRLTPRAGGRTGTIDVTYYGDSGTLKTVQVISAGSDPKPITDALKERLTPTPAPTDLEILQAEKQRVEAMAAICASYAKLTDRAPSYCNK